MIADDILRPRSQGKPRRAAPEGPATRGAIGQVSPAAAQAYGGSAAFRAALVAARDPAPAVKMR
eukprot:8063261-Alexandrium_andersonii.AAC.1